MNLNQPGKMWIELFQQQKFVNDAIKNFNESGKHAKPQDTQMSLFSFVWCQLIT